MKSRQASTSERNRSVLRLCDQEDKKKIDKCLEALEKYFKPTRNVMYERYVFNTCSQTSEESVQTYVTRLRK